MPLVLLGVILGGMVAYAQGTSRAPGTFDRAGLDLPVGRPEYSPPGSPPKLPAPEPPSREPTYQDDPPPVLYGEELPSGESLVYVLDVSCSMRGERLDRAKEEVLRSIAGLQLPLRFGVVAFSCDVREWTRPLQLATPAAKASASEWVSGLSASGATNTGPATVLGLGHDPDSVALLTDGAPNCSFWPSRHRDMIRSANRDMKPVNVFGISASGRYREWCQAVASDSGGYFVDVP